MKPYQRGERGGDDRDGRLADDQKAPLIHNIRERARRNCKQKHRQAVGDLHHRDDERVGIKARHQPAGSDAVHPAADVRDDGRNPNDGERPMTKRIPCRGGCLRWRGSPGILHDTGVLTGGTVAFKQNPRPSTH